MCVTLKFQCVKLVTILETKMTSKVSITDKLKTFEVSPNSSQDFEASQNEFDSSEDILVSIWNSSLSTRCVIKVM